MAKHITCVSHVLVMWLKHSRGPMRSEIHLLRVYICIYTYTRVCLHVYVHPRVSTLSVCVYCEYVAYLYFFFCELPFHVL